jgi:hypothetical protein
MAQRRQKGLEAADSTPRHEQEQEQSQHFANQAGRELIQARQRQPDQYSRLTKTSAEVHVASIGFLNTEADTGLNLARIAADSRNTKGRARNRRHAREAYDAILAYLDRAAPTNEEREAIHQKMVKLRELLKSLGERL